jgi:MFS family permease
MPHLGDAPAARAGLREVDGGRVLRTVSWRLLPLLVVLYVVSFVDRVNIGVAALRMNGELGLSPAAYGLASGIFFLGYVAFQAPSNMALHRVGARRWIAVLLVAWGLASTATAFVWSAHSLYAMRLALGAAEAGFFPGVICYLARWFPCRQRARAVAAFLLAIPLANVVGAPVSGLLVQHANVVGFAGWRMMFLLEGTPAVLLGLLAVRLLPETPRQARWLALHEREWLTRQVAEGVGGAEPCRRPVAAALRDRRVLLLSAVYAGLYFALYAVQFFLPQMISDTAGSQSAVVAGSATAACYATAALAMLAWSRRSDRADERIRHVAVPALTGAAALAIALPLDNPALTLAAIGVAITCVLAAIPVFWSLPAMFLTGASAAAGTAVINSLASVASFASPYATGTLKQATGGYGAALAAVAFFLALTGAGALSVGRVLAHQTNANRRRSRRDRLP